MKTTLRNLKFAFSGFFMEAYFMVLFLGAVLAVLGWVFLRSPLVVAGVLALTAVGVLAFFVAGFRLGHKVSFDVRKAQLEEWARAAGNKGEFDHRMALVGSAVALGSVAALEAFGHDNDVPMTASPFVADNGMPIINTDGTPMVDGVLDVMGNAYGSSGALGGTDSFSSMESAHSAFSSGGSSSSDFGGSSSGGFGGGSGMGGI